MSQIIKILLAVALIIGALLWVFSEEVSNFIISTFNIWADVDETKRNAIEQLVKMVGAVAGVGSLIVGIVGLLKKQKEKPKDSKDLLREYYSALHKSCETIDLALVDEKFSEYARSVSRNINLPVVYQEMDVLQRHHKKADSHSDEGEFKLDNKHQTRKPLLHAAASDELTRVVVLGEAGSGKSMFTDNLAWLISGSHLSRDGLVNRLPKDFRWRPIIRVRLRSAAWLCKQKDYSTETLLFQAMQDNVKSLVGESKSEITWEALKPQLLERGVILLDGVDEVPETDFLRHKMLEAIDYLVRELKEDARLIITSRPYVFDQDENVAWLEAFPVLELQNMLDDQVRNFIENWYQLLRESRDYSPEAANKEAKKLFNELLDREDLLDFARLPLLLTLLTSLHFSSGILPHSRAELFDKAIGLMLERWTQRSRRENPDYPLDDFEKKALKETETTRKSALQGLALNAHDQRTLKIKDPEIKGLFSDYLSCDSNPKNLLDFVRYRSGILRPGGEQDFEFYHRHIQAYLASIAITELDDWQDQMNSRLRESQDWWSEVFLLLVSAKIWGNSKPDIVSFLLSYYVPEQIEKTEFSEEDWHRLLLVAQAMIEQKKPLEGYASPQYQKLLSLLKKHLVAVVEGEEVSLPVNLRAKAGRLLGELGDPRPGTGFTIKDTKKIPDFLWIEIPGGEVELGFNDDEIKWDWDKFSTPRYKVPVESFKIASYPITNAQYRCFVDDGGYADERYWQEPRAALDWLRGSKADLSLLDDDPDLKKNYENWIAQEKTRLQPWYWEQRKWNNPNHPVVGVSWYEALAFCNWANDKGMYQGEIRLPSEAEWEYAARGSQSLKYAWGNESDAEKGNYEDTGLERTTTVGLFDAGQSFGVYDMTGNVWEWTNSQWGKKSKSPDFTYELWAEQEAHRNNLDEHALRITRGGSWNDRSDLARCAIRFRLHPNLRLNNLGFRVVLVE